MNSTPLGFIDLLSHMNNLRYLMIMTEQQHGLGNPKVLRYSEELDKLLRQFQFHNR